MGLSNLPPGVTDRMIEDQVGDDLELEELVDELRADLERVTRERDTLRRALMSDATLAGCVKEIERLTREVQVLTERNEGLMGEKNAAIAEKNRLQRALNSKKP